MKTLYTGFLVLALFAFPASGAPSGIDIANRELRGLWTRDGLPLVKDRLDRELQAFVGTTHGSGRAQVEVLGARGTYAIDGFLGLVVANDRLLHMRLPVTGVWRLGVTTDVEVRVRIPFFRMTKRLSVSAEVRDLVADVRMELDSSDPLRPKIVRIQPPQVAFDVRLRTNKWYLNVLLFFLRGKLNSLAHKAVQDAIAQLDPQLALLKGQPNTTLGVGGPGIAATQPGLPLEQAALKIHEGIVRDHLPFGSLASIWFSRPYSGTWEDALTDPNFTPGTPTGRQGGLGDSAIWTGHYLAACAFRYAVTSDPAAKAEAETVVASYETMLRMRGVPGLLNRGIWPAAPGRSGDYVDAYQGTDYVMWDFISRDQYMGVVFGLSAAYELIPDSAFRAKVRVDLELALDYILSNNWTAYRRGGDISVSWANSYAQQLAWLNAGVQVNPQKYAAQLADYAGVADLVWIGSWISTLEPYSSYYKFNLSHGILYTLLRLETDPGRWFKEMRGMRILRAAIGHHQNAHFDMCVAGHDPALAASGRQNMQSMLSLWLKRPLRYITWDLSNDPTIDKVSHAPVVGPTGLSTGATTLIAKYPLPIPKRHCTDFTWQREPIKLTSYGDGREQEPGVDFILPYWMGRYFNGLP